MSEDTKYAAYGNENVSQTVCYGEGKLERCANQRTNTSNNSRTETKLLSI